MKDYKSRSSNLQFRDRKPRRSPVVLLLLLMVAAGAVLAFFLWPGFQAGPAGEQSGDRQANVEGSNAIPLALPPAPAPRESAQ